MQLNQNGPDHDLQNKKCAACVYDSTKALELERCSTCGLLIHAEARDDGQYFCRCTHPQLFSATRI
jgi:hypothetical protein